MNSVDFEQAWKNFEEECRSCQACGLRQGAQNVVIYRGNKRAPLMVIGEAPGRNEDELGKPFVGRSGQLLEHLLQGYGLDSSIYHICNIVKCRPPENRRPELNEISACKKHLAHQFLLVRPRIILLCGSTAYEAFFGTKPVMRDVRGKMIEKNGYLIMTTFHPAYALRNPKMKIPMNDDICALRRKMEELGIVGPLDELK